MVLARVTRLIGYKRLRVRLALSLFPSKQKHSIPVNVTLYVI